jgi:hypothetical protein
MAKHAASTPASVVAGNSISIVSFPWLLRRGAGRQLLPLRTPAVQEALCMTAAAEMAAAEQGA